MKPKVSLFEFGRQELQEFLSSMGEPSYRASQIWEWLYKRHATDFEVMTSLSLDLRQKLDAVASLESPDIAAVQHSKDGHTEKLLSRLADGNYIETVLMRYEKRRTLCISTQAGCAMGCVFCATGQMGFLRNLSVGEIIVPVLYYARKLATEGERVTNIVMMGMGEPLHNYDNTLAALDRLTDPQGMAIGARRITLSTVGLVPAMRRYADEGRQSRLAVSLHAATDEERDKLIPVNRRWPISELMDACRYYVARSGLRITFEWALISGQNDTVQQAQALARLISGMRSHVNLIPLNPTDAFGGSASSRATVERFRDELAKWGISSTVRVRRGIDISAGCGQLRDRIISEA
jgi:23S rRNA (adenine2503-C2)-methyltransferase